MCINIKQLRDGLLREKQFEFTVDISDVEPTVSSPVTVSGISTDLSIIPLKIPINAISIEINSATKTLISGQSIISSS